MSKKEFLKLLDKYLAGEASFEEEKLLFKVYQSFQDKQEWDTNELGAIDLLEDKLFEKLKHTINQPDQSVNQSKEHPAHPIRHLFIWKFIVAASVAIIITVSIKYAFKPYSVTTELAYKKPVLKNDFKAGGNNAYLILSNGKMVHLNNAKIGLLAQQGRSAVIKRSDGQIAYNPNITGAMPGDTIPVNKIIVPVAGQFHVTLPDGTNVWLNSVSSLEYPVQFSGKERQVKLTGEAYFEVAKNKNMPFVVNVNNKMNVKVLGTHFNITAYNDENKISTTLLEGSVKIENFSNPSSNRYLIPGQQAELFNNGRIKLGEADVDEALAWKEGQFLFNNENIHSIMRKLSRWYNVDVVYSNNMEDKNFDGTISKYKNISAVLKLMELTKSVHFKFEGRRIIVMP